MLRRLCLVDGVDEDVDLPSRGGDELERRPGASAAAVGRQRIRRGGASLASLVAFLLVVGLALFDFIIVVVVVYSQEGVWRGAGGLVLFVSLLSFLFF